MHNLPATVIDIFNSSGHTTAQKIASKLVNLAEFEFLPKSLPGPPLPNPDGLPTQPGAHPCVDGIIAMVNHLTWNVVSPVGNLGLDR